MAVSVTRIDGQNVGLRLLGQTSVSVLSLNLTSGVVTSPYLTTGDCTILQTFALRLFQTVPVSARAAAAIGLLSRLCAVSPADASTVTLSASVAAGVATLTASIAASPASLIMTLPYAMSGGIMPSSGGGGSGPPTPSNDSNLVNVTVGEPLGVGQLVATTSGVALLTNPSDPTRMPCVGMVEAVVDALTVTVRVAGVKTGLSGLTPGRVYFAGTGGSSTLTPSSTPGDIVQAVGFSVSSSDFAVALSGVVTVR
jgi:hypothetical protein